MRYVNAESQMSRFSDHCRINPQTQMLYIFRTVSARKPSNLLVVRRESIYKVNLEKRGTHKYFTFIFFNHYAMSLGTLANFANQPIKNNKIRGKWISFWIRR